MTNINNPNWERMWQVIELSGMTINAFARHASGALDWLFAELLSQSAELFPGVRYFDFGTCNEQGGHYLNEGLIFQKEGFGGRAICYDTYSLKL